MQSATDNSEEACLSRESTTQLINMSQWSPSNIYLYNKGGFFFLALCNMEMAPAPRAPLGGSFT